MKDKTQHKPSSKTEQRQRSKTLRVLVVDDEPDIRELLDLTLARMGLSCDCAANLAEARALLAGGKLQNAQNYQLCLTDMRLPDGEGIELVRHISTHCPDLPVAVITAHGSMENAVSALKAGAFDYLAKPVSLDQLRALVKAAIELPQRSFASGSQRDDNGNGNDDGSGSAANDPLGVDLFGSSAAIQQARDLIARVARSQAPVYVTGESGSGKELAARLIHRLGARREKPFIAVNCGAIPETLMESEFFGHRKGAFTGADQDRAGFFQAADGGTLFLDEVADLPLAMQVKLLRAIQEKSVRQVGATSEEAVDVRIICATHQDLKTLVDTGKFRQDLYYRLNVINLRMPPLRECREDIPSLAQHILQRLATEAGMATPQFTPAALQALSAYTFPGNVRELENMLERALALLLGEHIDVADLQLSPAAGQAGPHGLEQNDRLAARPALAATAATATTFSPASELSLRAHLDQVERQLLLDTLQQTADDHAQAAARLGISAASLRHRLQRLGLPG